MIRLFITLALGSTLLFSACIGDDILDDFIAASVRITSTLDTLKVGDSAQLEVRFFNNAGREQAEPVSWQSTQPDIISVTVAGKATALKEGTSLLIATVNYENETIKDTLKLLAGKQTTTIATGKKGTIRTTSSYVLQGSFTLTEETDGRLTLSVASDYRASSSLPGLVLYLTNNPGTNAGAYEVAPVKVFSGAHTYTIPNTIKINQYSHLLYYCKPFSVKVGDGAIE